MNRCALVLTVAWCGWATAGEFRAAAGSCDITPPVGFPLWGYANRHDAPSTGVRDRLMARTLVMECDGGRVAFVSLDLGRPPDRAGMARIRERVRAAKVDTLFLVASHTHHGPVLELDTWPTAEAPWTRTLEGVLATLVTDTVTRLEPARASVAVGQVPLNRNRHSKRPDPPLDRDLTVVRVEKPAGKPVATLVNFAAHPTLLDSKLHDLSADYPGVVARTVETQTGAPCLFLQGWAGDLSPERAGTDGSPEQLGVKLADAALALVGQAQPILPRWRSTTDEMRFACTLDLRNPFVKLGLGRAFFPALVAAYEREYVDGVRPELTAAVWGDDLGIVAASGELFCGHGLSLKRRAGLKHVILLGYCNGYHQYFPTIEGMAEGGYGATPPVALAPPGSGERVADRALVNLYSLRGKLPPDAGPNTSPAKGQP